MNAVLGDINTEDPTSAAAEDVVMADGVTAAATEQKVRKEKKEKSEKKDKKKRKSEGAEVDGEKKRKSKKSKE